MRRREQRDSLVRTPSTASPGSAPELADGRALVWFRVAATLSIIAGMLVAVAVVSQLISSATVTGSGFGISSGNGSAGTVYSVPVVSPVAWTLMTAGVVFLVAELVAFIVGFNHLSEGAERFRKTVKFGYVGVGGAVAFLAVWIVVGPRFAVGPISASLFLEAATIAVTFRGLVGTASGVWRLGTHFGQALFRPASILMILPVASVAGGILLFVATAREQRRH